MAKQIRVTKEGLKKLEDELDNRKSVIRNEIAENLKTARGYGDLSENSEYDAAKDDQASNESRIAELEAMLKNIEVIDSSDFSDGKIGIGATVKLLDVEYKDEITYKIVGSAESDPVNGLISDDSPVGAALMGHAAGDEIIAEAPAGHITFKILDVTR